MLKIYGSMMCPDCLNLKANLDKYNIPYEYLDINENLNNLHDFLILRDSLPIFDHIKEINDIGLPTIINDDEIFLDWEGYLKELGYDIITSNNDIKACNINDRKGC